MAGQHLPFPGRLHLRHRSRRLFLRSAHPSSSVQGRGEPRGGFLPSLGLWGALLCPHLPCQPSAGPHHGAAASKWRSLPSLPSRHLSIPDKCPSTEGKDPEPGVLFTWSRGPCSGCSQLRRDTPAERRARRDRRLDSASRSD